MPLFYIGLVDYKIISQDKRRVEEEAFRVENAEFSKLKCKTGSPYISESLSLHEGDALDGVL